MNVVNNNVQLVVSLNDLKELWRSWVEEHESIQNTALDEREECELMTPTEFAQKNKVSKTTIWRWVKSGVLRQTIIGSKVYYRQSDLRITDK